MGLSSLSFEGEQAPTGFGIAVGDISFALEDLVVTVGGNDAAGMRSMSVDATTQLDGGDVDASATVSMAMRDIPQFGEMSLDMSFELDGADAELLGRVQRALETMGPAQDPMTAYATIEDDLLAMFAAGFDMNFERLDLTLPQGTIASKMLFSFAAATVPKLTVILFSFAEKDPADFVWTSLLMTTEATIDLSIPEAIVEMIVQVQPAAAMAIGGGYLVKKGDAYEMAAEMKKGLLTVNGAPIPIPLGEMR